MLWRSAWMCVLIVVLVSCGSVPHCFKNTTRRGINDWKYVESQVDKYFACVEEDANDSLGWLEKSVIGRASDEELGKIIVYSQRKGSILASKEEFEASERGDALFLFCLEYLGGSPDPQNALKVLGDIRPDLCLDGMYSEWYKDFEKTLLRKCRETKNKEISCLPRFFLHSLWVG